MISYKKGKIPNKNNRSSPLKENIVRFLMGGENIFIFIFHLSLNPEKNVGSKKINIEWRYYFLLLHISIAKRKKEIGDTRYICIFLHLLLLFFFSPLVVVVVVVLQDPIHKISCRATFSIR